MELCVRLTGESSPDEASAYSVRASLYGPCIVLPNAAAPRWRDAIWQGVASVRSSRELEHSAGGLARGDKAAGLAAAEALARGDEAAVLAAAGGLCTGTFEVTLHAVLREVVRWTAETPFLYLVVFELLPAEAAATAVDVEACWVGMRTVSIDGRKLRVNGVPLSLSGVNRSGPCMHGRNMSLADSTSFLHAHQLPLRGSQILVDTALERASAELCNAA